MQGGEVMRYRIADAIIDLIHAFWFLFLITAVGTFAMGSANGTSVFAHCNNCSRRR